MEKKKKTLIIIASVLIVTIVIVGIIFLLKNKLGVIGGNKKGRTIEENGYVEKTADNTRLNISERLNQEKEFDGFKVSNIKLEQKDKETILTADVTNVTGKDTTSQTFFIVTFLDNNNDKIGEIPASISAVKNGEKTKIFSSVEGNVEDYTASFNFKMEIDKNRANQYNETEKDKKQETKTETNKKK